MSTPITAQTAPATRASRLRALAVRRTHLLPPVVPVAIVLSIWTALVHFDMEDAIGLLIGVPLTFVLWTVLDHRMHARYPQTVELDEQRNSEIRRRPLVPGVIYGITHAYPPLFIALCIYAGIVLGVISLTMHYA